MTITDIDLNEGSTRISQSDDAHHTSSENLESIDQSSIETEHKNQQVDQFPLKPVDESNPIAIWIAIVTLAICFCLVRRIVAQPIRRGRGTPLLPSHEELRRLREARLAAYEVNKPHQQGQNQDENDNKTRASESEEDNSNKDIVQEQPAAIETLAKEQTSIKVQSQHQQRLRRPALKSLPPRKWEPIKSAVDLLNWTNDNLPLCSKPISLQRRELQGPKKLLLVHDMAGNYAEDALMDGWFARPKDNDSWVWGFRPSHLIWVDTFVYFSHNLVSVPPKGWIDCCHRHGSKVLGTFLTEWEAGEKCCEELFSTKSSALQVADRLYDIAWNLGFDGWLINIENRLSIEMVNNMKIFLAALSSRENKISVIWYDSVISRTGELKWQNGLNAENVEFFLQVNDGILTNYGWGEQRLMTSHATARAVGRSSDLVWHGIDVFGRGTFGGGGMSCDLALNLIDRMGGSSACLFAPGWTLENAAERNATKGRQMEQAFFHKLLFNSAWGEIPPVISLDLTQKGLFTDFSDGGGSQYYSEGLRLSSRPWLSLSRQRLQPRFDIITPDEELDAVAQRRVTIRCMETGLAYCGSCSIQMVGRRSGLTSEDWCFFPILSLSSRLGGEKGPASILKIVAAFHMAHGDAALGLQVASRDKTKSPSRVILVPQSFQKEGTLPAIHEKVLHGWTVRTWELRTYELRGRNMTGVTLSPLPMLTGTIAATWVDVRLGFVSLDESMIEVSECCPQNVTLSKSSHCLNWTCACGRKDTCAIDHVVVSANGSFRLCAEARGPVQMNDLAITALGILEDVVSIRACFWDGSYSNEITAESVS